MIPKAFARGAENRGPWLTHPQAQPAGREQVWMLRGGNGKVRFLGWGGQVGPQHDSVVAATYWAFFHRWYDPWFSDDAQRCAELNSAAAVEVCNNSTFKGPEDRCGCGGGDKPWHVGIPEYIALRPERFPVATPAAAVAALVRSFRGAPSLASITTRGEGERGT